VCGPERVLADEVARAYQVPGVQQDWWFAGEARERDIWDSILTVPPGPRVVFVRHAEKLRAAENFGVLARAEGMDTSFVVFLSAEPDFTRVQDGDGKKVLAPHLAVLQASKSAQLVRCNAPGKEEDLLQIIASWWPGAGKNLAAEVLRQCGGSLTYAWQACDKAKRAGLSATNASVELVRVQVPGKDFADALVAGDKKEAMAAAAFIRQNEVGAAIGILASRLGALSAIWAGLQKGWDGADLAMKLKMDRFLLRLLRPHAGAYSPERVQRCQEVLAVAESAWRSGSRTGVPEAIAALW
jgi:hypothetical protein